MAHLYTYLCMDNIIITKESYQTVFPINVIVLFSSVSSFLLRILLKLLTFLQVEIFLKLVSLNFPSCSLPQFNLLKKFIGFSISKRRVQKQKLSLIWFHIFGMIIILWGLVKTTGNTYGVLNHSKESMLLRILRVYWGRRVCILKVVMLLRTNLI